MIDLFLDITVFTAAGKRAESVVPCFAELERELRDHDLLPDGVALTDDPIRSYDQRGGRDRHGDDVKVEVLNDADAVLRVRWIRDAGAFPTGMLDAVARGVLATGRALPAGASFSFGVSLGPLLMRWRRPRPPRTMSTWAPGALLEILDRRWPGWDRLGDVADRLVDTPMPAHASRVDHGDLIELRWARDPLDAAEIERAAVAHERWLARVVDAEVDRGWNARGDQRADDALDQPFALIAADDLGAVDPAEWADIGAKGIRTVVVPRRSAAVALAPRAHGEGRRVLYQDGDGVWWDPFPRGDWIEDDEDAG